MSGPSKLTQITMASLMSMTIVPPSTIPLNWIWMETISAIYVMEMRIPTPLMITGTIASALPSIGINLSGLWIVTGMVVEILTKMTTMTAMGFSIPPTPATITPHVTIGAVDWPMTTTVMVATMPMRIWTTTVTLSKISMTSVHVIPTIEVGLLPLKTTTTAMDVTTMMMM